MTSRLRSYQNYDTVYKFVKVI